jgi:hypothetical protein
MIRSLMWLPALAQCGAVAVQLRVGGRSGLLAQLVALFIMLVVYGLFGIQRFRTLRGNYASIKRRRVENAAAFRNLVDAHLPSTTPR